MMVNGVGRCYAASGSPAEFADLACGYLRRLGYTLDHGVATWLALLALKARRKGWPPSLVGRRVMGHVYRTAGWPPALMPEDR